MAITEDYVSFETAKLLKEKGFEGFSIIKIYDEDAVNVYIKELEEKHLPYSSDDPKLKEFYYTIPTIQMAMKWLREVHNLHIMVNCIGKVNYDPIVQRFDGKDFEIEGVEVGITRHINGKYEDVRRGFKTYEQACEAAIKYCLKHLI